MSRLHCRLCLVLLALVLAGAFAALLAQSRKPARPAAKPPAKAPKAPSAPAVQPVTGQPTEEQLTRLARALREQPSPAAYARLREFANRHSATEVGARAALALGYYDYTSDHKSQALGWFERAWRQMNQSPQASPLREYALYWRGQANHALGREAEALAQLELFRREYPESAMTEQALQSLAEAALAAGKSQRAAAALAGYDKTASKLALLLLRARARDRMGEILPAARDYMALYYGFPLSDEAKAVAGRLTALEQEMRAEFPRVSLDQEMGRAEAFYEARQWREARREYQELLPQLRQSSKSKEVAQAELRLAQCRIQLERPRYMPQALAALAALELADPELDAERLYTQSQAHRAQKQEAEMLAAIEQLAEHYPQSRWTEDGLFAAGNYFWVNLDRQRAVAYYRRVLEKFPAGKNALAAHWRVAWTAYLERRREAGALLEEHLRRFPGSPYTQDALYWLGRLSERSDNTPHARSFYLKAKERFPQTYFGAQAAERLRAIGTTPLNPADLLSLIPAPPPLPQLDDPVPASAAGRWVRAQALRSIAFDASAELELRAAYASTESPRLLWEAARAAADAGRYTVAIATARQVVPQLEARKLEEVAPSVWQAVFPLPYETPLRRAAERNRVDPVLVAGMIRQESLFQADAVSHAGAVGLMQVLPKTGRKLARRLRLRYWRARLFKPEYNLQLGTLYLADLFNAFRSPEAVLAAFNAGEDRVTAWEAERSYQEPAEFVESIPFTETREYVQIVMRNADLYRQLYGKSAGSGP